MLHAVLPVVWALAAAALAAVGTVLRQSATTDPSRRRGGWLLGALLALAGFAFQAAALATGSVLVVQPVIVLSVLFALPAQRWLTGTRATRREWTLGGVVALGVAVFLVSARPVPARHGRQAWVLDLVLALLLLGVVALVVTARRRGRQHTALRYGTAAGALFGMVAVQVKDVSQRLAQPLDLLSDPTFCLFAITVAAAVWC